MATEYLLTITRTSQGRMRKGELPPKTAMTIIAQPIQQSQIVDIVKLLNDNPKVKVSKDGVPTEVVNR